MGVDDADGAIATLLFLRCACRGPPQVALEPLTHDGPSPVRACVVCGVQRLMCRLQQAAARAGTAVLSGVTLPCALRPCAPQRAGPAHRLPSARPARTGEASPCPPP